MTTSALSNHTSHASQVWLFLLLMLDIFLPLPRWYYIHDCLSAGLYYRLDLPTENIRRWVLVQLRSHKIMRVIWIFIWLPKKKTKFWIFPVTYYHLPWQRHALSECFSLLLWIFSYCYLHYFLLLQDKKWKVLPVHIFYLKLLLFNYCCAKGKIYDQCCWKIGVFILFVYFYTC